MSDVAGSIRYSSKGIGLLTSGNKTIINPTISYKKDENEDEAAEKNQSICCNIAYEQLVNTNTMISKSLISIMNAT